MPQQTLSTDFATYESGVWQVNNNVWNKGTLVNGVDFTQSVTFNTDTVPNGITFTWDWGQPADYRVYAYPEIAAGSHPWGGDGPTQLTATVSDVKNFNVNFDLDITGDTSRFNVAIEFWLTRQDANGGTDITTEVMIWLHNGDLANGADFKFQYADGSFSAGAIVPGQPFQNFGETWNYIALATNADYLTGSIDLHDILVELQRLGLVNETDTIGGFELGAEVTGGAGSLTVNSLSYDFGTYAVTEGADVIAGGAKEDNIWGHGGNDTISGGAGGDVLYGENGGDALYGGTGDDTYRGGEGADIIYDASGADIAYGGAGADTLYGIYVSATAGRMTAYGDQGDDMLIAGAGSDTLYGGTENDVLWGDAGNDTVWGDAGNDSIFGGAGSDVLIGGDGKDYFNLYYDVKAGDFDYIYGLTAGQDYIFVPKPAQAGVSYYQLGADAYGAVSAGGGYYYFGANAMTVAQLQSTVVFI